MKEKPPNRMVESNIEHTKEPRILRLLNEMLNALEEGKAEDYYSICYSQEKRKTRSIAKSGLTSHSSNNWGMMSLFKLGPEIKNMEELQTEYQQTLNNDSFRQYLINAKQVLERIDLTRFNWAGLNAIARCGTEETNSTLRFRIDPLLKQHHREDIVHKLDQEQFTIIASLPSSNPILFEWLCNPSIYEKVSKISSVIQSKEFITKLSDEVGKWYNQQEYDRREKLIPLLQEIISIQKEDIKNYPNFYPQE